MWFQDSAWLIPPTYLTLRPEEVHVWRIGLDQPENVLHGLWGLLSPDEQRRAQRFHFERDRRRFIVGRGSLRRILSQYLGLDPANLEFGYSSYGKPSLTPAQAGETFHFNLSHSHELALCACGYGQPLGVDLEWVRPLPDLEQIAQRFFSARENDQLQALPTHQRPQAFFNCWTRKEAYLKACGVGLARPLDQFDVSLVPDEPAQMLAIEGNPAEAARWCLQALTPESDYAAALAIERTEGHIRCWQWPAEAPSPAHSA